MARVVGADDHVPRPIRWMLPGTHVLGCSPHSTVALTQALVVHHPPHLRHKGASAEPASVSDRVNTYYTDWRLVDPQKICSTGQASQLVRLKSPTSILSYHPIHRGWLKIPQVNMAKKVVRLHLQLLQHTKQ